MVGLLAVVEPLEEVVVEDTEGRCLEREANKPRCLDMEREMELRTWLRSGATGGLPPLPLGPDPLVEGLDILVCTCVCVCVCVG